MSDISASRPTMLTRARSSSRHLPRRHTAAIVGSSVAALVRLLPWYALSLTVRRSGHGVVPPDYQGHRPTARGAARAVPPSARGDARSRDPIYVRFPRAGPSQEVAAVNPNAPVSLVAAGYRTRDEAVRDLETVWGARHDGDFHHISIAVLGRDTDGTLHV